jgi:hypothetical protein
MPHSLLTAKQLVTWHDFAGDELEVVAEECETVTVYAGLPSDAKQFISSIFRMDEGTKTEIIRARMTWIGAQKS